MKIIGIDPSSGHGGIATLNMDGSVYNLTKMPPTPEDISSHLRKMKESDDVVVCYLEDVGYGRPNQSIKATAEFARHCGHLDMALIDNGIKTVKVRPPKWMKVFSLGKSSDYTKTEWKNRLKAKAQEMFPEERVTLATSDALLIAEYGRQKEK